jgi:hypothetical protein
MDTLRILGDSSLLDHCTPNQKERKCPTAPMLTACW